MNHIITNRQTGKKYRIISEIGEGAYAKVYKGEALDKKEIVAIKKMKTMKPSDSAMVEKEVKLMKLLNHKNIVKWIDDFKENGIWFIVLQYCGKGDLQNYKKKVAKIPENMCKYLVKGILDALVEIHSQKIITTEINKKKVNIKKKKIAHRDLKLPNILINDNYQLKLADFGFSKDFEDGWTKTFCGTPLTMAPQVLRREKYNQKCDVWSLGVITYYMIYHEYPYLPRKSDGAGLIGLTNAVSNRTHTFSENVQLSDIGKDFINQCLKKRIDQRPSSEQLLKHPWWKSLISDMKQTQTRAGILKKGFQVNPVVQAQLKIKNLVYQSFKQHLQKLTQVLYLNEQNIINNINKIKQYYSADNRIQNYYQQLILLKLIELQKRQIIIKCEQKQFVYPLSQINLFKTFIKKLRNMLVIQSKTIKNEQNIAQQLIVFIGQEAQKLMEMFNQDQIDNKIELFKNLAHFIIADYDPSMINVRWGERQDLNHIYSYILDLLYKLNKQQVINRINEEEGNEEVESIWSIQHHINSSKNSKTAPEYQLGKLYLSILNISSNFNIDTTMQTEVLEFKNIQADFIQYA